MKRLSCSVSGQFQFQLAADTARTLAGRGRCVSL